MSKRIKNSHFICSYCSKSVPPLTNGSYRNHCPFCLYSLHVDESMGDRKSKCNSLMKPIGLVKHSKKGYQKIHKCLLCDKEIANIIAEGTDTPDDFNKILKLTML